MKKTKIGLMTDVEIKQISSYSYYKILSKLTGKKHNTIKQYFNRNKLNVKDINDFNNYLTKVITK